MRRLIVAVLVVAGLWMGFWAIAQTTLERGIRAFISNPQPGVEVTATDVSVVGFPNRLDTTLTDIAVTLPENGTVWTASFVRLFALVYRPTEVIAALPPEHVVETPLQRVEIAHDSARASAALQATDDFALDRATLVIENGRAASSLGWGLSLDEIRLSIAEIEDADYRLGAEGLDIRLDAIPDGVPQSISRLHLDARAAFTQAWDRTAMKSDRLPQITSLDIADITVDWGGMSFLATGAVTVDRTGTPDGQLDLTIVGWQEALDALTRTGILPADIGPALRFALATLADGDRLNVPLGFRNGLTTLGPLPVGPAPNLTIR